MCFSATASFTAAAALLPAGAYCVGQALHKGWRLLPLAVVPTLFAAQQLAEGFVWLALDEEDPRAATRAGLAFLAFALWLWPVWMPLTAAVLDLGPTRGLAVRLIFLASLGWFVAYGLVFLQPDRYLSIRLAHHIVYDYSNLPVYAYLPLPILRTLYIASIAVPLAIAWHDNIPMRWLGVLFALSIAVGLAFFADAFASVWCFFAAALSAGLCLFFRSLPAQRESSTSQGG
jgi:hypothetical protein